MPIGDAESVRPAQTEELNRLFAAVYDELRRVAHNQLRAEPEGHTLDTTSLVNEAYLRLASQRADFSTNRDQFFSLAATAMRRILVDYARRHRALKRPSNQVDISLTELEGAAAYEHPFATGIDDRAEMVLALDDALRQLSAIDARLVAVVEQRFFAGRTEAETAMILGVTSRTVARDWVRARAWLAHRLDDAVERN